MTDKQKKVVAEMFGNVGGNQDVRSMGLSKGMTLHPILTEKIEDCLKQDSANGNPFLYVPTEEEVRLSVAQLTRRGNGLNLTAAKQAEAFEEWYDRAMSHTDQKCTLTISQLFTRELSDGNVSRSAVFKETFA